MKYMVERVREYINRKTVRARMRKAISILCCVVVFVTTYALVLPSLSLEKTAICGKEEHEHTADCYTRELVCGQEESEAHQHTDECYEDVLTCGKEVHVHTLDCYEAEEPEEEEPAQEPEEPAVEETAQEPAAEETDEPEETVEEQEEEEQEEEEQETPAVEEPQEQEPEDDPVEEQEEEKSDSGKTEKKEDVAEPEKLGEIDFADLLTNDTDVYYLPENAGSDDWEAIDGNVKLDPEEEVLLHFAYKIPAGHLNPTNVETEYVLPLEIPMTEERVEEINKNGLIVFEGTDRKSDDLKKTGEVEIEEKKNDEGEVTERKFVIRFNEYAAEKAGGEKLTDGTEVMKPEKIEGFFELYISASDLLGLEKDGDASFKMKWNDDEDLDTIIYFDEEKLEAFLKAQTEDASQGETDGEPADDAAEGKTDDENDQNEDGKNVIIQDMEEDEGEGSGEDAENPEEGSTQTAAEQNEADVASDEEAEAAPEYKLTVGEGTSLTQIVTDLGIKTEDEAEQFVSEEVEDVRVSNNDLIEVTHKGKILWIFGKEDWTITAKDHFISRETLTVTMKDGEVLEIILMDADFVACEDGKTYEVSASGETYDVILSYGAESGLPAEGVTLDVTEITPEDEGYDAYLAETEGAVGDSKSVNSLRLFDIKIIVFGKEVEPTGPVNVSINMKDMQVQKDEDIQVLHFQEEGQTEVLDSENVQVIDSQEEQKTETADGEAVQADQEGKDVSGVSFTTDGFSVYGVAYTVDFEYSVNGKMYQFSLPGGGFVSFTDLVEVLGIIGDTNSDKDGDENGSVIAENTEENATNVGTEENGINSDANTALTLGDVEVSEATRKFVADVASVEFSTPSLVDVSKVESETTVGQIKENRGLECEYSAELTKEQIAEINAQTVEAGDWALISVQPFTSEEQLTVTMKDGEVFKIRVTDAQIKKTVIDAKGDTWEITVTYGEDAQIPNGAELKVREILPEDEEYEQYYQQSLEKVGVVNTKAVAEASEEPDLVEETVEATEEVNDPIKTSDLEKEEQTATQTSDYARIFDIEIWADDHKVEPAADVTVSIKLLDAPGETEATPQVVHFAEDGAELMVLKEKAENSEDEGIQFVTDEFSVYSVVYTVDFSFNINGKEYSFSLEGGDSTSFKEIIERFKILDKENVELFINNIATVEFSNPDYLWNGKLEEDAFAGDLKEKYNLDIQYASNIREGNILAMNVHHYSAPDWVLIALKPFSSEETLSITMKNGEKFTVKVTDAQSDAVHNTDGTVQTIPNPQGTTFDLFNYYVSEDTKTTAGRDQWPGHIHDDNEFWKFNWYNFDGSYERSWNDGFWYNGAGVPETWRQQHLLGYGNNLGINKNHNFKFSPANAGTVIDGTKGTVTKDVDGGSGLNGWTQDADPYQGIVQDKLSNGYPILTNDSSKGTDGTSLAYLFDNTTHEGKDSYGNVNNLLYVDPDGYYTYDSRDFKAEYQNNGTFKLTDQPDTTDTEVKGFWPFGTKVYWSGLHMNTQFSMPENGQVLNPKDELKDMQFEFSGDDDTWLYVDGVLVGDGGGIHNRTEIDVNFATGKVIVTGLKDTVHTGSFYQEKWLDQIFIDAGKFNDSDWEDIGDGSGHKRFKAGTYHTFDMFYLERGGGESNLYIHYNLVSTDDFTGHKSYEGFADGERMARDQFHFELIGLDGQYQSVWNETTQSADVSLVSATERAIMPGRGSETGTGSYADPKKVYSSVAYTDSDGHTIGGTILTSGVLENGDIRFGSANISADEMLACDQGHPSVYRYIIREIVPDDAVNDDGITWAEATDEQKEAGGFVKDQVLYDREVYYMTARVTSWNQTGSDGQTYKAYGLSKTYYKDDTFTEVDNDVAFVDFRNLYAPDSGSVEFAKVDGMGNPLAGATFTLYTDEACTKVAKDLEGVEQVITTESDGKVVFDNMAAPKTYYMKETGVPTGYQANNTVYKVTIEDSKDTTKTSKIIVNGDETEAAITQIINTKPGEISVVKKWVDPSGKEVAGGNNTAKVQLRRYNPVLRGGGSTHNVTVKMSYTDYNNYSGTWEKTVPISGSTAIITWKVLDGADAQSVFDGYDDTGWQENPRATILYRTVSVNSDVTVNLKLKQYWPVGNGKFNFDNDLIVTGSGSSETIDYQVDTSFPSTADTEATQVLSIANNWTYAWTIGDGDSYDFPATDGTNPYLYYLVELKPDGTEVAIDGEVQEGITLREISYSPSLTENAGIQQGVITVKNEVTAPATTDIVIKKYKKDDLNNASAETLKGATFRLEKYTSSDYQGKDTGWSEQTVEDTEETGIFNFTDLEEGFYKIVEVDTPDGYIKISTDPTFEVRNVSGQLEVIFTDTNLVTYTPENGFRFGNEPGAALPSTGGPGTRLFTILGSILILGAGVLLLWRRRTI